MKKNKPESLEKARGYAFLLLKFRLRSEKEITQRLKEKKFDEQVIKETIEFLKERKFIDDQAFAKAWIESRIRKPLGLRRLRQELSLKGIDKKIIDAELEEVKKGYIELDIVKKIVRERFEKLKGIQAQKAKFRLYTYLLRRGYSSEIVREVLNKL